MKTNIDEHIERCWGSYENLAQFILKWKNENPHYNDPSNFLEIKKNT